MSSTSTRFVPPIIPATNPTSTNPIPGAVYGAWWLAGLNIMANDPVNVQAQVTLVKYAGMPDGTIQFSPVDPAVSYVIGDLLAAVQTSYTMQSAYLALMAAIQADAASRGLI